MIYSQNYYLGRGLRFQNRLDFGWYRLKMFVLIENLVCPTDSTALQYFFMIKIFFALLFSAMETFPGQT